MLPTLSPRSSLDSIYHALLYTLVRLRLDPRLAAFVPCFEQLQAEWEDVSKEERSLLDARAAALAKIDYVDGILDATSDGIASTLLLETGNNRKAPLYVLYFGSQKPSRFRRPVLGAQLQAMRTWSESLKESKIPSLVAYGEALPAQIAAADEAAKGLSIAEQKLKDARLVGVIKGFVDKVNGARKQLHGDVSKMLHDHPEWSLSRDYVTALFEHESAPPELSVAELDQKIEASVAQTEKLRALRDQRAREAAAEEAARWEAEKKAQQAQIDAAAKAAADAAAKLAALKTQFGLVA